MGAVLLLKSMECVPKAREILPTGREMAQSCGTHPETALRLKFLDIFDHSLPNEDQIAFRGNFIKIIDSVWMKLREW
jgi:hypothetical protein